MQQARLTILQVLADSNEYTSNDAVLEMELDRRGYRLSSTDLREQIGWLRDAELLRVQQIAAMWIVRMTSLGRDVARGRERWEGVARPKP